MPYKNLFEAAEDNEYLRRWLESDRPHTEVAELICEQTDYGTSETSVRRWRAAKGWTPFGKGDNVNEPHQAQNLETSGKVPTGLNKSLEEMKSLYPDNDRLGERNRNRNAKVPVWTPGLDIGPDDGELRTVAYSVEAGPPPDADILEEFNLDPDVWEVVSRRESKWQSPNGEWLEAHRLSLKRRTTSAGRIAWPESEEILRYYSEKRSAAKPSRAQRSQAKHSSTKRAGQILCVPVGDLQVGKIDGDGSEGIIGRFGRLTAEIKAELDELDDKIPAIMLPWLGDCIEGIVSQGGRLATRLDLSVTEQVRVVRRLMMHQIAELSPYAERVLVCPIAGNHDENYRMVSMPVTDSWALEAASEVADALKLAGGYDHVQWLFPEPEELSSVVDVGTPEHPFIVGMTHGHIMRSTAKALDWWRDQAHGRQAIGEADLLLTGHWHHLRVEFTGGGRTWIQIPALDGGSDWFRRKTGDDQPAGMTSLWLTPGRTPGWQDLTIHS